MIKIVKIVIFYVNSIFVKIRILVNVKIEISEVEVKNCCICLWFVICCIKLLVIFELKKLMGSLVSLIRKLEIRLMLMCIVICNSI